jgi:hypothetical protein
MARRRTREALLDYVDADIAWRTLELSALKTALARAKGPAVDTAARSAVALAYAHWEGYVVKTSRALIQYVADLRLSRGELADSYLALSLAGRLHQADASTRRIEIHIDVINELRRSAEIASFPAAEKMIQADGNLKSEKFQDIVARLGLNPSPFELHYKWLDSELLRRRNKVAHGDDGYTDSSFALDALTRVHTLMDQYRTAIQNAVALEAFRVT